MCLRINQWRLLKRSCFCPSNPIRTLYTDASDADFSVFLHQEKKLNEREVIWTCSACSWSPTPTQLGDVAPNIEMPSTVTFIKRSLRTWQQSHQWKSRLFMAENAQLCKRIDRWRDWCEVGIEYRPRTKK